MRSTLLALATAAAVGLTALAPTAASAQHWHGGGWHGGGWHGGGWGPGIAGFAAGAAIGSAIAGPRYGYNGGYYDGGYYDDGPAVAVAPGYVAGGGDPAYCAQRYRSYDPASGTFLGYDGIRHPCP